MMYVNRRTHSWLRLTDVLRLVLTLFSSGLTQQHLVGVLGHTAPVLDPDMISFHELPQLAIFYQHHNTNLIRQIGLHAPQGADFEGPDPGLNAAIISAPEICPNNYMRDAGGRCRPSFSYGPNPLSTFSPEKFKGSIQFYMDLQIGRPTQFSRRRNFFRFRNRGGGGRLGLGRRGNRLHLPQRRAPSALPPLFTTMAPPSAPSSTEDPPEPPVHHHLLSVVHPFSILPTPPPLTGPVAEITAILEALHDSDNQQSSSNTDGQGIDDDDD